MLPIVAQMAILNSGIVRVLYPICRRIKFLASIGHTS